MAQHICFVLLVEECAFVRFNSIGVSHSLEVIKHTLEVCIEQVPVVDYSCFLRSFVCPTVYAAYIITFLLYILLCRVSFLKLFTSVEAS